METLKPELLIKELIRTKEAEQREQGRLLKEHFLLTYESLKPLNVLRNTLKEAISSPGVKTFAIDSMIGLAGKFIANKLFPVAAINPLSQLTGKLLKMVTGRFS